MVPVKRFECLLFECGMKGYTQTVNSLIVRSWLWPRRGQRTFARAL
jgi:hypothetical protein